MFDTVYSQIGGVIAVAVVGFAFLKGDEPERIGAGAYILALLTSLLVQDDRNIHGSQWSMMAVDVVMLVVYAGLAWKSRLSWPVWAVALQALTVMVHVLTAVDRRPPMYAYLTVINLAAYGIMLAIAIGTFHAWRDRRAVGAIDESRA